MPRCQRLVWSVTKAGLADSLAAGLDDERWDEGVDFAALPESEQPEDHKETVRLLMAMRRIVANEHEQARMAWMRDPSDFLGSVWQRTSNGGDTADRNVRSIQGQ